MVTLDDMLQNQPEPGRNPCKLSVWMVTLSEDDRNAIHRAMDNENLNTRHIYRTIKAYGYPGGETAVRNHRRGECLTCKPAN